MKWTSIAQFALGLLPAFANAKITPTAAGVHVIYSYPGPEPPQHLYDLIDQGKVGGIVLFEENVHDGLPDIINKMQDIWLQSLEWIGSPLLIMAQQEGGELSTFPGGPNMTAKEVGESATPESAVQRMVMQTANTLNQSGVNTNIGPVMGVFRKEGDFLDQNERSFSDDIGIAKQCTREYLSWSFVSTPVLDIAKYFPGMGAATADDNTDEGPVTIDVDIDTLRDTDMMTFEHILLQQVGYMVQMIMPSWAVYPAIDPDRPAGLSSKIIKGELRDRLKFKNIIISDNIQAGALAEYGDDADRAVLALEAGVDIVLASGRNVTQGEVICDAIMENFNSNMTSESYYRISDVRELLNPGSS